MANESGLRGWRVAVFAGLVALAVAAIFVALLSTRGSGTTSPLGFSDLPTTPPSGPLPKPGRASSIGVGGIPPSAFEQVSVADASERANFTVLFPDSKDANLHNLLGVQDPDTSTGQGDAHRPITTVQMEFPPPTDTGGDLRQPYISIFEEESQGSGWSVEAELQDGRGPGQECNVGSITAVCVSPRSPADSEQANAAYLRFERDGVVVEISGGDSLPSLLGAARSLYPLPKR